MSEDIKTLVEKGNRTIEAVREAVDRKADAEVVDRIKADLASTLTAKSELEAKNTALETRLSALEAEKSRPDFSGKSESDEVLAVKSAFDAYMRKPTDENVKAYELALKSINITNATNGGIAVDTVIGPKVLSELAVISPMRSLANVISVGNEKYIDIIGGAVSSGWAGELDVRAVTPAPTFDSTNFEFGEVYANIEITNHALNDMSFDVEAYVIQKTLEEFAAKEGLAFVSGDGVNKPAGFALPAAGISTLATGNATGLGANPADRLIQAYYELKYDYRNNATWVMNAQTLAGLVSVKDADGRYLLAQPLTAGTPAQLLGRPVREDEGLANVAANATPIFVGDFKRGYTIADVGGTFNIIKENVTRKGFTTYYVSKRVGGGVTLTEALRGIKVEA